MFTEGKFRQYKREPCSLPYIGYEWLLIKEQEDIRCLTCICGHPVRLGRLRRLVSGDQASFDSSFEKAVRKTANARAIAESLYARFASKQPNVVLAERITLMENTVLAIPRPKKNR
jgi:hypothetical protein